MPDHAFSHHAPIWWGNLLMIFIEGTAFAILAASYFYSDSYNDLPMLERVGKAVAINPDARLRRHARKNGWSISQWSYFLSLGVWRRRLSAGFVPGNP